jgi:hypothetical protein
MSRWADRAVRLVARTLPVTIRDRYREEWRTDAAAAPEAGISPASVVLGAAVFSATLDRDAPAIAGMPTSVVSQRHARWALTFAGVAAIVVLVRIQPGVELVWFPVALALIALALVRVWAAARLSSTLAVTSAALGTGGIAIFAAGSTLPALWDVIPGNRFLYPLAMLMLMAAVVLGLIAWGGLGLKRGHIVALSLTGAVSIAASWYFFLNVMLFVPFAVAVGIGVTVHARRRAATVEPSRAHGLRIIIVTAFLAIAATVVFGTVDLLVLSPLVLADGHTLDQIYSALPETWRVIGIGDIVVWITLGTVLAIGYLVVGLVLSRTARAGEARLAVLFALALASGLLLSRSFAGSWLIYSIIDALGLGGFTGPDYLLALITLAQAALLIAIVAWIAPRRAADHPAATSASSASP